jgi:nitrogen fixation protein NifU and related proteins
MTDKISDAQQLSELGYSNKAIELYQNKVNVGVLNDCDTDAVSIGTNGDLIRLYIKLDGKNVEDAKFLCYGCPGSTCALSALTLLITGKPLHYAKKLTENDIIQVLGGLPETNTNVLN